MEGALQHSTAAFSRKTPFHSFQPLLLTPESSVTSQGKVFGGGGVQPEVLFSTKKISLISNLNLPCHNLRLLPLAVSLVPWGTSLIPPHCNTDISLQERPLPDSGPAQDQEPDDPCGSLPTLDIPRFSEEPAPCDAIFPQTMLPPHWGLSTTWERVIGKMDAAPAPPEQAFAGIQPSARRLRRQPGCRKLPGRATETLGQVGSLSPPLALQTRLRHWSKWSQCHKR